MKTPNNSRDEWKSDGDELCKKQEFFKAILCYDEALRHTTDQEDAITLLLFRCNARVNSQHYDSAIQDAEAVLHLSGNNEMALSHKAAALYGLRRFRDCANQLTKVSKLNPKDEENTGNFRRCLERLREEKGHYDFAAMLDEAIAKNPNAEMDRADYVGPIEVRTCADKSHGRGIFSIKPIKVGELLLVEKAFCATFPPRSKSSGKYDTATGLSNESTLSELQAKLAAGIFVKLHRNPSQVPAFAALYPGPNNAGAAIDEAFVESRKDFNSFEFPVLSADWMWRAASDDFSQETPKPESATAVGIWLKASMINHSCYTSVRRSFVGDMMIWRAERDISVDTELHFGYVHSFREYDHRQEQLANYGFACGCELCHAQRNTSNAKLEERDAKIFEMIECNKRSMPVSSYFTLIQEIEITYDLPPTQEPRLHLIVPIITLMRACKVANDVVALMRLGLIFLRGLGFQVYVTNDHWAIMHWGFMADEVVWVLTELIQVFETKEPKLCKDLYKDLKTAYIITAGEAESFEGFCAQSGLAQVEKPLDDLEKKTEESVMVKDGKKGSMMMQKAKEAEEVKASANNDAMKQSTSEKSDIAHTLLSLRNMSPKSDEE